MVFNKYIEEIDDSKYSITPSNKVKISAHIELKRIKFLDAGVMAYNDTGDYISRHKLIKLCIDNLIKDLNGLSNEEAVKYIKNLYKDALF